jgi:hypothetical protein
MAGFRNPSARDQARGYSTPSDKPPRPRPTTKGQIQPAIQKGPKAVLEAIGFPDTEIPRPKNDEKKRRRR